MIQKKGQHEIIGFVLIIVVVAVIGLFLLLFALQRGDTSQISSVPLTHLLAASMHYTSDCAIGFVPSYRSVEELMTLCFRNEACLDGENSCAVLNETLSELIGGSLRVSEQGINKGYRVDLLYLPSGSEEQDILLHHSEGTFDSCRVRLGAQQQRIIQSGGRGTLTLALEVCER